MAIVMREAKANACRDRLAREDEILLSSATLAETLIVANSRARGDRMRDLLNIVAPTIAPVSEDFAHRTAQAYARWGKGFHRARLNFGDCFAYALAKDRDCPLLFVGDDFSQTDIVPALPKS